MWCRSSRRIFVLCFAVVFVAGPASLAAETGTPDSGTAAGPESDAQSVPTLEEYNIRRDRVTRVAMATLGSWSIVNMGVGTALALSEEDPELRAFHQMNAGWNIVNAALAIPSFIGAQSRLADPPSLSVSESLRTQNRLEDTLLFNAGIDFAYIAAGFYLTERARRGEPNSTQLAGFGRSLMVQGGFLLAFDLVVYIVQRQVGRGIEDLAGL